MSEKEWRRCATCGKYNDFWFYSPDSIFCEGCDTKVGETETPVESGFAALSGSSVFDTDSNEILADVVWYDEKVTE